MPHKKIKLDFSKYYKNPYYPSEDISLKSAANYRNNERELPLQRLLSLRNDKQDNEIEDKAIVHWFRKDLRIQDNTSLINAIKDASANDSKLIGLYVVSTKFWRNHMESPWKIDLIQRRLKDLKGELKNLNIPLSIAYFDDAKKDSKSDFFKWFEKLVKDRFNSKSVYFNLVYDYDEIHRDISLYENTKLQIKSFHDECIVKPFTLQTGKGTEFKKYSPWFKKWCEYLSKNPVELEDVKDLKKLKDWDFKKIESDEDYELDDAFKLHSLTSLGTTDKDIKNVQKRFPTDDAYIHERVNKWVKSGIKEYESSKTHPSLESTSVLSPYISSGCISTREIIATIQKQYKIKKLNSGDSSVVDFIMEIAWRDFYKHALASNPFLQFDLPYNFNSLDLELENDKQSFQKWCLGETGYPIVDASMRQLLHTGWINNRSRMIVSTFLSKDLLIDWRWGMNWFHERLIDGEYSSNHGGWTWCSSTGIDCQPWFRIFSVERQSKSHDPDGEFIKKWCPELKDCNKNDIHTIEDWDGYPDPIPLLSRDEKMERLKEAQ